MKKHSFLRHLPKEKYFLLLAIAAYLALSCMLLAGWTIKDRYTVTGDEPHYLVMAKGIIDHYSLEQTLPYGDEFRNRSIYKHGLAPIDATPNASNTHSIHGLHGLFNIHNVGLPILLSIPTAIGGVLGAKLFTIAFGCLIVYLVWNTTAAHTSEKKAGLLICILLTCAMPIIPAITQIYPDIYAGTLCMLVLNCIYLYDQASTRKAIIGALAVSFLPWLQIKFFAPSVMLFFGLQIRFWKTDRNHFLQFGMLAIYCTSLFLLSAYNHYAFGNLLGPYGQGALEVSRTSLMVLIGLHLDQNQGFLLQNPVFFIGLASLGLLYRKGKLAFYIWLFAYLSLVVPNALHPNWYGGWSFSGRFTWAACIVFMLPTIIGLSEIYKNRRKCFYYLFCASLLLQAYFYIKYATTHANLYNKPAHSWLDGYSLFYFPFHDFLPALYNAEWAFKYFPNYIFVVIALASIFGGFYFAPPLRDAKKISIVACFLVFIGGIAGNSSDNEIIYRGSELPSLVGRVNEHIRFCIPDEDKPGYITFGPYIPLSDGEYKIKLSYSSSSPFSLEVANWDVYSRAANKVIDVSTLHGTDGKIMNVVKFFKSDSFFPVPFEFRSYWMGKGELKIYEMTVSRVR